MESRGGRIVERAKKRDGESGGRGKYYRRVLESAKGQPRGEER
jgi:hypothetical protein